MKVLLDECIPRKLKKAFVDTVIQSSWFDVFLTPDRGIQFQQNLAGRSIALLILRAKSNRIQDLLPHVAPCREAIRSIRRGDIVRVGE
jgi:hypothetical protein